MKIILIGLVAIALYGIPRELFFSDVEPFNLGIMALFVCGSVSGAISAMIFIDKK